jgi:hypothetical protein
MARREILRDRVADELDPELIRQRRAAGWRLAAVEWERDTTSAGGEDMIEVPYGMRVAGDCHHIEEDPSEAEVLRTVMRMVVEDRPLSKITEELNRCGHRTRSGRQWTISEVFELMPVLVDNGPRMFADPRWAVSRSA